MDDKMSRLVRAALAKTEAGKLEWKAFNEDTFRAAVGGGMLHLQREWVPSDGENGDGPQVVRYSIRVLDNLVRVVRQELVYDDDPHDQFVAADDLFRAARNSALGSEQVIDEMLSALGPVEP